MSIQNQFKLTYPLGSKDDNENQNFEWSLTSTMICKDEARALNPPWRGFTGEAKSGGLSVQFLSCVLLFVTPCNPMDCSTPGFSVHHKFPELAQAHVHQISDAIQPSHALSSPSPPAFNLSQHQGLFQWVSSSHQVAIVLEFQLQCQSFQWIFRSDFL